MNKSNNQSKFSKDRGTRGPGSSSSTSARDTNKRSFDKDHKAGNDFSNPRERFSKNDDKRSSERKSFQSDRKSFGADRDFKPRTEGRYSDRPERRERTEGRTFDKKPYGNDRKPFGSDRTDRPERDNRRSEGSSFEKKPYGNDRKPFGSDRTGRPERDNRRPEGSSFEKKPYNRAPKSFGDRPHTSRTEGKFSDHGKNMERTESRPHFSDRTDRPKRSDKPFVKPAIARAEPRKRSEGKDFSIPLSKKKDDDSIRLNRYIANSGVCSRRKADELILAGVVTVNEEVVTSLGTKVNPAKDDVRYNGERLKREKMVYVLLNKPKDYITTTDDPQERRTVMHLIDKATQERIYPVGRLDRNTTGLLLMTNDGALADKLSHPKNSITKIYHVELDKAFTQGDLNKVRFGLELEDGPIKPDEVNYVQGASKREVGIQIHSGKNRIVRRIFESLGYAVVKLDRVIYANLTKKDLPRGRWRHLEEREVIQLKHFIK